MDAILIMSNFEIFCLLFHEDSSDVFRFFVKKYLYIHTYCRLF